MKNTAILILLSIFLVIGCNEESSILEPSNEVSDGFLPKGRPILNLDYDYLRYDSLAAENGDVDDFEGLLKFKAKYSKNFTVDGDKGAVLFVRHSWRTKEGQKIKMTARLTIPKGAYKGELNFDMIFDLENYALELYPSPFTFDNPVYLDLSFGNINLPQDMNVDFTYLDGKEKMNYNQLFVSPERGSLRVLGAELHHFSRYGWTRTTK
ncbi:MAG: hypothetical protein H6611_06075 [Ignavibacteriales bacterium]|nr:hypothetical protein [Ignavibacteriales bacterium]